MPSYFFVTAQPTSRNAKPPAPEPQPPMTTQAVASDALTANSPYTVKMRPRSELWPDAPVGDPCRSGRAEVRVTSNFGTIVPSHFTLAAGKRDPSEVTVIPQTSGIDFRVYFSCGYSTGRVYFFDETEVIDVRGLARDRAIPSAVGVAGVLRGLPLPAGVTEAKMTLSLSRRVAVKGSQPSLKVLAKTVLSDNKTSTAWFQTGFPFLFIQSALSPATYFDSSQPHSVVIPVSDPLPTGNYVLQVTVSVSPPPSSSEPYVIGQIGPPLDVYLAQKRVSDHAVVNVGLVASKRKQSVSAKSRSRGFVANDAPATVVGGGEESSSSATQCFPPVILVPGIMGSTVEGLKGMLFPRLPPQPAADTGAFELTNPFGLVGWNSLKTELEALGHYVQLAPYDWSLSISTVAQMYLEPAIDEALSMTGCDPSTGGANSSCKVIIVAHSMGGLVTRAYMQGSRYRGDVATVIFLGTPHLGGAGTYLMANGAAQLADETTKQSVPLLYTVVADYLLKDRVGDEEGYCEAINILLWSAKRCNDTKLYLAAVGNMKSLYQLLPTYDNFTSTGPLRRQENQFLKALNGEACFSPPCVNGNGVPYSFTPWFNIVTGGDNTTAMTEPVVNVMIIAGTTRDTIVRFETTDATVAGVAPAFPDGAVTSASGATFGEGDGSVPTFSALGVIVNNDTTVREIDSGHASIIKNAIDEIVEYITSTVRSVRGVERAAPRAPAAPTVPLKVSSVPHPLSVTVVIATESAPSVIVVPETSSLICGATTGSGSTVGPFSSTSNIVTSTSVSLTATAASIEAGSTVRCNLTTGHMSTATAFAPASSFTTFVSAYLPSFVDGEPVYEATSWRYVVEATEPGAPFLSTVSFDLVASTDATEGSSSQDNSRPGGENIGSLSIAATSALMIPPAPCVWGPSWNGGDDVFTELPLGGKEMAVTIDFGTPYAQKALDHDGGQAAFAAAFDTVQTIVAYAYTRTDDPNYIEAIANVTGAEMKSSILQQTALLKPASLRVISVLNATTTSPAAGNESVADPPSARGAAVYLQVVWQPTGPPSGPVTGQRSYLSATETYVSFYSSASPSGPSVQQGALRGAAPYLSVGAGIVVIGAVVATVWFVRKRGQEQERAAEYTPLSLERK